MELTFDSFIQYLSGFVGGSTTLAGLLILIGAWVICAVICAKSRASPSYSVVPMLPISIFLGAYGVLNETVAILICVVCAAFVASELKRTVD